MIVVMMMVMMLDVLWLCGGNEDGVDDFGNGDGCNDVVLIIMKAVLLMILMIDVMMWSLI